MVVTSVDADVSPVKANEPDVNGAACDTGAITRARAPATTAAIHLNFSIAFPLSLPEFEAADGRVKCVCLRDNLFLSC